MAFDNNQLNILGTHWDFTDYYLGKGEGLSIAQDLYQNSRRTPIPFQDMSFSGGVDRANPIQSSYDLNDSRPSSGIGLLVAGTEDEDDPLYGSTGEVGRLADGTVNDGRRETFVDDIFYPDGPWFPLELGFNFTPSKPKHRPTEWAYLSAFQYYYSVDIRVGIGYGSFNRIPVKSIEYEDGIVNYSLVSKDGVAETGLGADSSTPWRLVENYRRIWSGSYQYREVVREEEPSSTTGRVISQTDFTSDEIVAAVKQNTPVIDDLSFSKVFTSTYRAGGIRANEFFGDHYIYNGSTPSFPNDKLVMRGNVPTSWSFSGDFRLGDPERNEVSCAHGLVEIDNYRVMMRGFIIEGNKYTLTLPRIKERLSEERYTEGGLQSVEAEHLRSRNNRPVNTLRYYWFSDKFRAQRHFYFPTTDFYGEPDPYFTLKQTRVATAEDAANGFIVFSFNRRNDPLNVGIEEGKYLKVRHMSHADVALNKGHYVYDNGRRIVRDVISDSINQVDNPDVVYSDYYLTSHVAIGMRINDPGEVPINA